MISDTSLRYAKILYQCALSSNTLEQLKADIDLLKNMLASVKEISSSINIKLFSSKSKSEMMQILLQELPNNSMVFNFANMLIKENMLDVIQEILLNWGIILRELEGYQKITVITAIELTEEQQNKIFTNLSKALGHKNFFIINEINPAIIAGLIVKGDNFEFDDSVIGKVNNISKALKGAID